MPVDVALAPDRYVLACRHGERSGKQTRDTGEKNELRIVDAARDSHHEAEVGDEAVVGSEHRSPEIAAARELLAVEWGVGSVVARWLSRQFTRTETRPYLLEPIHVVLVRPLLVRSQVLPE